MKNLDQNKKEARCTSLVIKYEKVGRGGGIIARRNKDFVLSAVLFLLVVLVFNDLSAQSVSDNYLWIHNEMDYELVYISPFLDIDGGGFFEPSRFEIEVKITTENFALLAKLTQQDWLALLNDDEKMIGVILLLYDYYNQDATSLYSVIHEDWTNQFACHEYDRLHAFLLNRDK